MWSSSKSPTWELVSNIKLSSTYDIIDSLYKTLVLSFYLGIVDKYSFHPGLQVANTHLLAELVGPVNFEDAVW